MNVLPEWSARYGIALLKGIIAFALAAAIMALPVDWPILIIFWGSFALISAYYLGKACWIGLRGSVKDLRNAMVLEKP